MEVLSCSLHLSPISSNAVQVSLIPTAWALLEGSRDDFALSPPFLLDPTLSRKTYNFWFMMTLAGIEKMSQDLGYQSFLQQIYHVHIHSIFIISSYIIYIFIYTYFSMIQSMISSISHPLQPSWASPSQQPRLRVRSRTRFLRTHPIASCQHNNQPVTTTLADDKDHGPKRPMPGHFPKQFAKVGRPEVVGRQVECQPEELDVASCYRVLQIAWMFKKSRMRCSICFLLLLLSFFKCFSSKLESFLQQGIEQ